MDAAQARLEAWFAAQGYAPLAHQREVWTAYLAGRSGLLHTPTGSGKTLAVAGGPLIEALAEGDRGGAPRLLWITPLRALAADTARALQVAIDGLGLGWQVVLRTGDASARDKRLARSGKREVVVTTPESLSLLLSYADTQASLDSLRAVVVDEWHELLGSKRGVLLELGLARLRQRVSGLRCWGLSATLGNLEEAAQVLLPGEAKPHCVGGAPRRRTEVECLLPREPGRFPYAGHLGLSQLPQVLQRLIAAPSSLVFTNTRAQAELWHQALSAVWPEDLSTLALHHGSIDPAQRRAVEQALAAGRLRAVVATSSLDLGVDFPPVEQVLQIGSPKGVARLLQRAGRAKHRPGESGAILGVPTHALEIAEYAAVRRAVERDAVESRPPLVGCLDVLAQHAVTLALGGGFEADALFAEVRRSHAYAALERATFDAVLRFIEVGGEALAHYPDYRRVRRDETGRYVLDDRRIALRHRLSIGTISSDGALAVKLLRGKTLGHVEERFVGQLTPGDRFLFAGRALQLVRVENMVALVKLAPKHDGRVPRWQGGQLPLSNAVGPRVAEVLADPQDAAERAALAPLREAQARRSRLPTPGGLLVERAASREGEHLFVYPFAGRQLHDGLAALWAWRLSRIAPGTYTFSCSDYGLMLSGDALPALDAAAWAALLSPDGLHEDLARCLNLAELARRQFREVARVAGLLPPSLPGRAPRSLRALQASSALLFDVLSRHDPGHLLLAQAEREVREQQLCEDALRVLLRRLSASPRSEVTLEGFSPLAFPLWAESQRGQLSTEDWTTRVRRAAEKLERGLAR
ncbi:ligase-associated DNA damage response DEXH box helicase [Lysobacter sp. CAU 1642]|uniref:Ligase-associated DNA damage response DEXH box helicase n=2 Tax=Pseudomarimonas salicorniae TaxID=2933270 RepID=A0ABT0GMD3_9GAMM|nr:ligase-associated DNA damage response DEXH box helicase [Lysobacter sp. CAU 1642]MCK7595532.1 ligase-associated DNA damage response DEXH box helicase [Lysobacter sp. CAU 1642]